MRLGLKLGLDTNKRLSASPYSTNYVNSLISKANTDGHTLPSEPVLVALDAFMSTLISLGIDVKLDALWVFATDGDRDFAKYNVLNPGTFDCTELGTLIFTANQGFQGNGVDGTLNTNWNELNDSTSYQVADGSIGVKLFSRATVDSMAYWGIDSSLSHCREGANDDFQGAPAGNTPNSDGDLIVLCNNTSSGETVQFQNTTEGATVGNSAYTLQNASLYLLSEAGSGAFSNAEISIAFVGASVYDDISSLNTAINAYIASL